ncbi:hypothetical protein BI347_16135 [Chromobacterium sphagni]|uniref:DUF7868 domain-containing protein n=2 Tax=Chromobacterium sphagni TaxID=1903179 RepID=A0A1S1WVG5_9NEIS|nr:hypothetical protein BI347_16135 [Chromobacterium sphagni]
MVAATGKSFPLSASNTTVSLSIEAPTGPALQAQAAGKARQAYLRLEKITGSGMPVGYEVYLHSPNESDPQQHEELCAGLLPLFGLEKASKPGRGHAGTGLHYVYKVTDLIAKLEHQTGWNPKDLRVTFVPRRQQTRAAEVKIGRVSLYYE